MFVVSIAQDFGLKCISHQPPDDDLSPPFALRDVSQVLREIMTVYDSSMLELEAGSRASDAEGIAEREEFNGVMDAAVGPALEMCRRMAELRKDSTVWEKEIFLVNCTSYLQVCSVFRIRAKWNHNTVSQSTFHPFTFATSRVTEMDRELDQHLHILVKEYVSPQLALKLESHLFCSTVWIPASR